MPKSSQPATAEHARLAEATGRAEDDLFSANPWYEWGPYLSERAWGTVREDYSAGGNAWDSFPHDHARSRAYRWNEDGMAGISDIRHELCLALALWNGKDPILKERMFGLTGPQGNHGEDVKEYWWYLEGLPSHALLHWRYHYPQVAFPYDELVHHGRGLNDPELELLDTGAFDDDRYWSVDVTYAKASPTEILARIVVENHAAEEATLDVFTQVWRQADRYEPGKGSPLGWLLTMARTRAIDLVRSRGRHADREAMLNEALAIPDQGRSPEDSSGDSEDAVRVHRALAAIPADQRNALVAAYFGGLSHTEVASALGQPLGTVKTRIRSGLIQLRRLLAENGDSVS